MEAQAISKYVLISPRKAKLAADLIKGKPVAEALAILKATPKKAADILEKTLNSAIANAIDKEGSGRLDAESLFVKSAIVDPGPIMPRWRARAFGRAARIRKRMSHIKVVVTTEMPKELKGTRKERKLALAMTAKPKK